MRARRWKRYWILTLAIYAACTIAFVPIVYGMLIVIFPSHRIEGHPTMPLGQLFIAVCGGPILALLPAFFLGRQRVLIT
jgi:hypothetical protein